MTTVRPRPRPVGELLRQWRERRRLSQLDLALQTGISTRHLSFLETGRSRPSRDMLLRLAEQLEVPLRERNHLLLAGGYAPAFGQTALDAPQMAGVRAALRQVLTGHEPFPALVVDRAWNLVDANAAVALLVGQADPELLAPPVNVLRVSLHPRGMAPRIANLGEWRAHLFGRLRRQVALTADPGLAELHNELRAYPCDQPEPEVDVPGPGDVVIPLRLRHGDRELSFLSIMASFGTPMDVTVAELAIESFFPADPGTGAALRDLAAEARVGDAGSAAPMTTIDPGDPLAVAVVEAIRGGDLAGLRRLLDGHPELATARIGDDGPDGTTRALLHVATDWPGHFPNGPATVAVLVEAGADVDARFGGGSHDETPLHWAASSDDVEVLDAGADIEAPGGVIAGGTPLTDARAFGQWRAAHRLVERGARTTIDDDATLGLQDRLEGYFAATTPDPETISRAFWGACHGGRRRCAEYLLDRGAELDWVPPWEPLTPLDAAARSGADDLVRWLRSRGARPAAELAAGGPPA